MDPALYKDLRVSRGLTYHYFYAPASAGHPTLLFLHGFPSTSYDWHRQVEHFRPKGYGILVPDLLGAGGTSKPEDPDAFRFALIARDIVDILDAEGLEKVVGIAHDWGSILLSRLANLHEGRFYAFAWNVVAYNAPRHEPVDIDALIAHMHAQTGNHRYGYWKLFNEDDAHVVCEQNLDSFLHLVYSKSPEVWLEWLTPAGKAREWLQENRTPGLPSWLSQEEYDHMREKLRAGGLKSYLNYYKTAVRSLNVQDDKSASCHIPEAQWTIHKPVLFVAAKHDAVAPPAFGRANMEKYAPHAKVVELETGHWVQLEATAQLNEVLEDWIKALDLQSFKHNL
ncbi:alpha/beta-hydrolase [Pilatotrama ljubarskyi]|nr:alpha/beta-hydrolase [Pilatotrama ljubarskyi]